MTIKARLNSTSNFLDQNNPKSKYKRKNELIYIRDFKAIWKTRSHVHCIIGYKNSCVFKPDNTLLVVF